VPLEATPNPHNISLLATLHGLDRQDYKKTQWKGHEEQTAAQHEVLSRQLLGATEVNNETSGDSFCPAKGFNLGAFKSSRVASRFPVPSMPRWSCQLVPHGNTLHYRHRVLVLSMQTALAACHWLKDSITGRRYTLRL